MMIWRKTCTIFTERVDWRKRAPEIRETAPERPDRTRRRSDRRNTDHALGDRLSERTRSLHRYFPAAISGQELGFQVRVHSTAQHSRAGIECSPFPPYPPPIFTAPCAFKVEMKMGGSLSYLLLLS